MALPQPEPALVISYGYLWHHQKEAGLEEGTKQRPCVIVLAVEKQAGKTFVTVAPITHRPPDDPSACVEIPFKAKERLGLDMERSWVVVSEVNQFVWPGYDLRAIPGTRRHAYGFLSPKIFACVKTALADRVSRRRMLVMSRD